MPKKLSAKPLTAAQLNRMATITDEDKARMVAQWKKDARGPAQQLITAKVKRPPTRRTR